MAHVSMPQGSQLALKDSFQENYECWHDVSLKEISIDLEQNCTFSLNDEGWRTGVKGNTILDLLAWHRIRRERPQASRVREFHGMSSRLRTTVLQEHVLYVLRTIVLERNSEFCHVVIKVAKLLICDLLQLYGTAGLS
ncbi:hypothetical protein Pyn_15133 [Prunus yedoensis var. nudiflora]|uniref:Uncharacterized protein n=1 Tax=Prunus yedoensis var. nudiflora TaxID=2094558 RepID=A0A314UMT1_PRUYE|nr:hypothetical protein Pyn_15133 [Prunus yedoensis var. nudiflora]